MKNKKIAAVILSVAMVVTGISCSQPVYAKKVSISDKKMILKVKEKKKLKLKNTSKKVSWKLSTKKYVTIKKVKKNCIYVIGKRAEKTKNTDNRAIKQGLLVHFNRKKKKPLSFFAKICYYSVTELWTACNQRLSVNTNIS